MVGMDETRAKRTAYHEAGHAVVAHAFGHGVAYVSMAPDAKVLGQVSVRTTGAGTTDWTRTTWRGTDRPCGNV
jgi:hypothetical protein